MSDYRIEKDSMGEMQVPADALYAAQTQRAVENFPISGIPFGRAFIRALGLIKSAAAEANLALGLLDPALSDSIQAAAQEVADGRWDDQFPIDIFQTGSGTSSNMNANEVIANRASQLGDAKVHPNDHVNMGQSSNDVIPTAIHVSAYLATVDDLLPALRHLHDCLLQKAADNDDVVKTGRTHLMDAMPVRLSQEIGGWAAQIELSIERIEATLPRLGELAQGGTAVGTGINAHPEFGQRVAAILTERTDGEFRESRDHFAAQASMDSAVELSGQLKATAAALTKIADDLRWMNSGPIAGFGEIQLKALQPGSSIMPGKINPVISEATIMVAAQVMGNDVTIGIAGSRGNFQLNVMLPVIAHNLLQSIQLLANGSRLLADNGVAGFTVNRERIASLVDKNPILVTALNPVIGYDLGAKVAKTAYAEGRSLREVAKEMTDLTDEELDRYLDPRPMTEGGIAE
ncbi:MAG: class II fumarate hydratase [Anaerolineales bacterium]|nr:class II fumarate hydratase [Anaerolineales bacterium]MCB9126435.1 class II fumarate hydratase [Ardenticatenales bacterium]MCB9171594.1 class II fumarate hydratase [Ardenticatenales bacterium]